jgi:hypothetical protein
MGDPDASGGGGRDDDGNESDRHDGTRESRDEDRGPHADENTPREDETDGDDSGRNDREAERDDDETGDDGYGEGFVPDDGRETGSDDGDGRDADSPGNESLREELADLREDVAEFEAEVEDRTVSREEVEDDLRAYVRSRLRRGHARGWGPYLVLLYGTAMTIGAFVELSGVWAILAMIVIWLSTLGLYVLMILFGLGIAALSTPGRAMRAVRGLIDTLRNVRS